jgi:hypothetical protein
VLVFLPISAEGPCLSGRMRWWAASPNLENVFDIGEDTQDMMVGKNIRFLQGK